MTLVSAGNTPGVVEEHAVGATIALLNTLVVTDCRWRGLGSTGSDIGFEDNTVSAMVRQRGNVPPIPPTTPPKQTLPESTKLFRMSSIQKGQMGNFELTGGTVTSVEHSPNGVNFARVASVTPCAVHVSPTDYLKITWSVEPSGIFVADRN